MFHGLFRCMFNMFHSYVIPHFQLPKMLLRSCFWCGSTIKHKEGSTQDRAATSLDDVIFHFAFKRNPNFVNCGDAVLKSLGFQMNSDCSMHVRSPFRRLDETWRKVDLPQTQYNAQQPGTVRIDALCLGLSDWNMPEHSTPVVAVGYSCQQLLDPSLSLWAVHPTWFRVVSEFPCLNLNFGFKNDFKTCTPKKIIKRGRGVAMWEDGVGKT